MRISITQLRAIVLVVNLVLAGSLVYKALAAYDVIDLALGEDVNVESHPARVDLNRFVYRENEGFRQRADPASAVTRVSSDLQPPKPKLPSTDPVEVTKVEEPDEAAASGEEELPEGPLAKEWEYVYYIAWQGESGARNFAQIRKKEEKSAKSRYSRSASIRNRSSTRSRTSTTRTRSSSKYKSKAKTDQVSFLVSDRRIQNEEFELDFWVHSADNEKLVYWMPGRPTKRYALPYKHEGSYLAQGPMRKELRPEEDEEEEEEEEEEEKKKSFYVIHEDADPEAAREQRYEEIIAGKTSEAKFAPSSGKSSRPGSRASSSKLSPTQGRSRPSKPTKEDINELKDALNKIPAKEQERLKKELQGMLRGGKK